MITALLNGNQGKDISLYTMAQTMTNDILSDPTYTLYKTVKGLYWKASGSKNNISDKFKEQVTACVIVRPTDLTESEISTDMKVVVSGEGNYVLVYADNIGAQNKVLQLNLKEWT